MWNWSKDWDLSDILGLSLGPSLFLFISLPGLSLWGLIFLAGHELPPWMTAGPACGDAGTTRDSSGLLLPWLETRGDRGQDSSSVYEISEEDWTDSCVYPQAKHCGHGMGLEDGPRWERCSVEDPTHPHRAGEWEVLKEREWHSQRQEPRGLALQC